MLVSALQDVPQKGRQRELAVVAESRARFRSGPITENLLPHARVLYDLRADPENAHALEDLSAHLIQYESALVGTPLNKKDGGWADRIEALSSIFEWLSTRRRFTIGRRSALQLLALRLSRKGYNDSHEVVIGTYAHAHYKLGLTYASLVDDEFTFRLVTYDVSKWAKVYVRDCEQRALIFIRLGMLLQERGRKRAQRNVKMWMRGVYWNVRGIFVWGAPLNVRQDGLAALAGIRR